MQGSILIAILLLTTGGTVLGCVMYAIRGSLRAARNRAFMESAASLSVWNFGMAILGTGADGQIRSLGAQVSAVGYTLTLFFLLRYLLCLTGREALLRRLAVRMLIWLPCMCVCLLAVLPLFRVPDRPGIPGGWVWLGQAKPGLWVLLFWCEQACFLAAAFLFLIRQKQAEPRLRKVIFRLMGAFALAGAAGFGTDILLPLFIRPHAPHVLPQIASVFWALPILFSCYATTRFSLVPSAQKQDNLILSQKARHTVYRLLERYLILSGVTSLLVLLVTYQTEEIVPVLLFSASLIAGGILMIFIDTSLAGSIQQELPFAILFSLLIPFIILRFYQSCGITVWVMVFPLMVVSLLFHKRVLLITVSACSVQSLLLVWSMVPQTVVALGTADHVLRLFLIGATFVFCLFANRIYLHRLWKSELHFSGKLLMSESSRRFLSANSENMQAKTHEMLMHVGRFVRCGQACVALPEKPDGDMRISCEWTDERSVRSQRGCLEEHLPALCRLASKNAGAGSPVFFWNEGDTPADMPHKVLTAEHPDAGRFACLPVFKNGALVGLLLFAGADPSCIWRSYTFLSVVLNTFADTLERIDSLRQIRQIAYHDQLTGLPNRVLFKKHLAQAITEARDAEEPLGIVFVDLDCFKAINDALGHAEGDRFLKEVAAVFRRQVAGGDMVCRFGGDEFVFLFRQFSGLDRLDRLLDALRRPIHLDGQAFTVTGSAGVAVFPADGEDAETLIKNADMAMYHAKGMGKNRYASCTYDMKTEVARQAELVNLLYRALERGQLLLYYQPQVNLKTGRIVGMEALMRWNLPGKGLISPGVFIPLLEQTGLIHPVGEWVLSTACRQAVKWREMGFPFLRMAVNISVQQLSDPRFPRRAAEILQQSGLPPRCLEFEVTESMASSSPDCFSAQLTQLKNLGGDIAIDDFGTGYSSFQRIMMLPADRIKLDIQFVQGIETSRYDRAVTETVISMAKGLHMAVVAEGVETAEQAAFLARQECDDVQGYYHYRPMPAEEINMVLQNEQAAFAAGDIPPAKGDKT